MERRRCPSARSRLNLGGCRVHGRRGIIRYQGRGPDPASPSESHHSCHSHGSMPGAKSIARRPTEGEKAMTKHMTGTREEWLAARLELLKAEKELTRSSDELARRRQELPWVRIEKEYRFDTDEGSVSLADLFQRRSQLLVYHFMFGPDYSSGCPSCSAIADGFNGFGIHLANHDVMLWAGELVEHFAELRIEERQRRAGVGQRF